MPICYALEALCVPIFHPAVIAKEPGSKCRMQSQLGLCCCVCYAAGDELNHEDMYVLHMSPAMAVIIDRECLSRFALPVICMLLTFQCALSRC